MLGPPVFDDFSFGLEDEHYPSLWAEGECYSTDVNPDDSDYHNSD